MRIIKTDAGGAIQVDVEVAEMAVTSVIPGTAATNLGKAEDAAHASGDVGVMSLAVRDDTPAGLAADGDYIPLTTDDKGTLWTHKYKSGSVLDAGNSTATPLNSGFLFTGTGFDCLGYTSVVCTLYASHDSAASGMTFQFSTDNSNWDDINTFTMDVSDSNTRRFQFPVTARYFRIVYTNGGTNQTAFRVQTILHTENVLTSIHNVGSTLTIDRSAQLVRAVIAGETTAGGGAMVNVKVNPSGTLETNAEITESLPTGDNNIGNVDVASSALPTGAATSAKQLADGHAVTIDNISSNEVFIRGSQSAGSPVDGEVVTIQGIAGADAVSVTESTPLTGFATSAKQLADGHNVTVDNGAAGSAVNIQDGGNTITVDGTVTATLRFKLEQLRLVVCSHQTQM